MRFRRRHGRGLLWAVLISLLVNHGSMLPALYLVFAGKEAAQPPKPVDVEFVPLPADTPILQARPAREPRARQPRALAMLPKPEQKPELPKPVPLPEPKPEPKPKPEPPKPPQPIEPPQHLKMVEVNTPESEKAPKKAHFLSDKNRSVEKETRARDTNLVKDHPKPEPSGPPDQPESPKPGSDKPKIAELEEQKAQAQRPSPLLRMRSPGGQQGGGGKNGPPSEMSPDGILPVAPPGGGGPGQGRGMQRFSLDHRSHDRIYGAKAARERELARLSPSISKGRGSSHQQRWERVRSALENFIPEVQPGTQTALNTRAHPFAVYIARMHRQIHKLWGFGFLVDLDAKPDRHPMNDMQLWTMIEIVLQPDGNVAKATVAKPSGVLTFDAAALDTVFRASPYPATPPAIRSADGRVYLHWRFHRDSRQCGTFGVDPFILTKPPKGPLPKDRGEMGRSSSPRGDKQTRGSHS